MSNTPESRGYAISLAVLSALGRLIPHAPNFTPLGASCLFAGSRISGRLAYLVPLAVMAATDPFLGGYSWSSPILYASFMVSVWIGRRMLSRPTALRVGAAALLGGLQFFLLSNFAVWLAGSVRGNSYYSRDLAGLGTCYAAAIPFWGRTMAADLLFSAALFGAWSLLPRLLPVRKTAEA